MKGKVRTEQEILDSLVAHENEKPGYIRACYLGSKFLSGKTLEAQRLKKVVAELAGPTLCAEVDKLVGGDKSGVVQALRAIEAAAERMEDLI